MYRQHSHKARPFHLGPLALERLRRTATGLPADRACGQMPADTSTASSDAVSHVIPEYFDLFAKFLDNAVAPARAPVPDDPLVRANNLKASAYFLDASIAGVCALEPLDWTRPRAAGAHACASCSSSSSAANRRRANPATRGFAAPTSRAPTCARPSSRWCCPAMCAGWAVRRADMRRRDSLVDIERLAVRAGVCRAEDGRLRGAVPAPRISARRGHDRLRARSRSAARADGPLDAATMPDIYDGVGGTRPAVVG